MIELIRSVLNEYGNIDKNGLRVAARKDYQFKKGGLPTLVYRTQPEYLKNPLGDNSKRGRLIAVFENTSPYDFLKRKNGGINPTARDLKIIEHLCLDLELNAAVVNVLIDYVLRINNNKFTSSYVETIASQWQRAGLKTASDAMAFAEKEYHKNNRKSSSNNKKVITQVPVWVDKKIEEGTMSEEEEKELNDLLKEFK